MNKNHKTPMRPRPMLFLYGIRLVAVENDEEG